ncbi:dUTP diphosphatase [Defluviimonas salinarum]|uniref:Deoxyuridine 5'-triphosphate nucleotidohydrolase n=1 Tax=Defluviimonas salinarum TaxID=2992147 RepID=A0ABT3J5C7_9RHOB|nr:dUTP diphosphatase [Defluviimonas salinarum]MCW3782896.1 dUTP diphosphatase [Defluviimonas salinarum]
MKPKILFVKDHPAAQIPAYETPGAAGADIRAVMPDGYVSQVIVPGARCLVATGLRLAIPEGWEVQIRPRSGLALKHGVTVLNGPGTIDSDYRGPLGVILVNLGSEPFEIRTGDRIAQMIVAPAVQGVFEVAESLDETMRGTGGFGSTGVA